MKKGSKYWPLYQALSQSGQDEVRLSFAEIEALLGEPLPPSARASRSWWSNRRASIQAAAWVEAGYRLAELDLPGQQARFSRRDRSYRARREGDRLVWDGELIKGLRAHLQASQAQLARELGVRQQTISEWETGLYAPSRAMCKYLTLVAERAGFRYQIADTGEEEE